MPKSDNVVERSKYGTVGIAPGDTLLECTIPAYTISEANPTARTTRSNIYRSKRVAKQRSDIDLVLRSYLVREKYAHLRDGFPLPLRITLTRYAPARRQIRDDDNLRASMKAPRDAVAKFVGADDRMSGPLRFFYRQAVGPWSVRVHIAKGVDPVTAQEWRSILAACRASDDIILRSAWGKLRYMLLEEIV